MRGSEAWEAQRKACSAPRLDASLVGAKNIILKLYKWEMAFFDGFRVLICPLRGYAGLSLLLLLLSSWPTFFCGKWHPVFLSYGYNLYIGSDFLSCTAAPTLPPLCLRFAFALLSLREVGMERREKGRTHRLVNAQTFVGKNSL